MIFPSFTSNEISRTNSPSSASFCSLRLLHGSERDFFVKIFLQLSEKVLHPSNLERQNVTYVLQVFNIYVAQALQLLGKICEIPHYVDTSVFSIIKYVVEHCECQNAIEKQATCSCF